MCLSPLQKTCEFAVRAGASWHGGGSSGKTLRGETGEGWARPKCCTRSLQQREQSWMFWRRSSNKGPRQSWTFCTAFFGRDHGEVDDVVARSTDAASVVWAAPASLSSWACLKESNKQKCQPGRSSRGGEVSCRVWAAKDDTPTGDGAGGRGGHGLPCGPTFDKPLTDLAEFQNSVSMDGRPYRSPILPLFVVTECSINLEVCLCMRKEHQEH